MSQARPCRHGSQACPQRRNTGGGASVATSQPAEPSACTEPVRPTAALQMRLLGREHRPISQMQTLRLREVHYDEFIPEFEKQYPEFPWRSVQAEIFRAFTELFQAACAKPPPQGLCDYPSSRAVYAIDLMLKWDSRPDGQRVMQPQILEVNFNPDCERACRYHPSFFNDVFSTLFLDEPSGCHVTRLV